MWLHFTEIICLQLNFFGFHFDKNIYKGWDISKHNFKLSKLHASKSDNFVHKRDLVFAILAARTHSTMGGYVLTSVCLFTGGYLSQFLSNIDFKWQPAARTRLAVEILFFFWHTKCVILYYIILYYIILYYIILYYIILYYIILYYIILYYIILYYIPMEEMTHCFFVKIQNLVDLLSYIFNITYLRCRLSPCSSTKSWDLVLAFCRFCSILTFDRI